MDPPQIHSLIILNFSLTTKRLQNFTKHGI